MTLPAEPQPPREGEPSYPIVHVDVSPISREEMIYWVTLFETPMKWKVGCDLNFSEWYPSLWVETPKEVLALTEGLLAEIVEHYDENRIKKTIMVAFTKALSLLNALLLAMRNERLSDRSKKQKMLRILATLLRIVSPEEKANVKKMLAQPVFA